MLLKQTMQKILIMQVYINEKSEIILVQYLLQLQMLHFKKDQANKLNIYNI